MKKKLKLTTAQIILFGFLFVILVGSLLLTFPISSADGTSVPYIDALFTATTSVCVTGLVTVTTATEWSTFGHIVILLLIQIGGLGVVTVMSGFMILMNRKIGISDRLLIQDAFNLNTMSGLVKFIKKVIKGTFAVEAVGALLYMTVFVSDFGAKGIWYAVFNSVSAFCNAGIDIIGVDSMSRYVGNPIINFTTCSLIILGGLGYVVWWDVIRVSDKLKFGIRKAFKSLSLQSKLAVSVTLFLIFGGAFLIFIFEYNNPLTLKELSLFDKIQASFFQSVTLRTAGFFTISQSGLTTPSVIVSVILMFIGGSPVGTAGGIKTVTATVLITTAYSVVKNKNDVSIFNRKLSEYAIRKSVAVFCTSFFIATLSTVLLSVFSDASLADIVFETVSATATVGLSRDLTPNLNVLGKLTVIMTMYFGRIGPISLAIALNGKNKNENIIKNPVEEINVG